MPQDTDAYQTHPAPTLAQQLAAEALGTFVLVLIGCGAAVLAGDLVGTALAFGIAVAVMIHAVGRVSGGHFNPAVSVGAALAGRIGWANAAAYVVAQVLGAIVGAGVLFAILQSFASYGHGGPIGANAFGDAALGGAAAEVALWGALIAELVLTFVFVMVILAVTDKRNEHPALAPLAIGAALTGAHLVAINITGTSVNPARSIGPALFAGSTDILLQLWVFIAAPVLGALLAGAAYGLIFGTDREQSPAAMTAPAAAVPGYGAPDQFQEQWDQPPLDQGHPVEDPAAWDPPTTPPGEDLDRP